MATLINYTSTGQQLSAPMKLTRLKVHQIYVCEVPLGTTCYNKYLHPQEYKAWNKTDVFKADDNHLQEILNWPDAFIAQELPNNHFIQNVLVCGQGGEKWMTSWQELMLSSEYGFTNNFRDFITITKELIEKRRGKQKYIDWTALRLNTALTNIPIAASFAAQPTELEYTESIPEFVRIATKGIFRIGAVQLNNLTGIPVVNLNGQHVPSIMLSKLFEWSDGHIPTAMFKNLFNTQAFSEINFPKDTEIQIKHLPIIIDEHENSTKTPKLENNDALLTGDYMLSDNQTMTEAQQHIAKILYTRMINDSGIENDLTESDRNNLKNIGNVIKATSLFVFTDKLYTEYLTFIHKRYGNAAYYISKEPHYKNMTDFDSIKISIDYKCEMGYCISINKPFCKEDVTDISGRHFIHVSNSTFELLQFSFPEMFIDSNFNFDKSLYKHVHYHQAIILLGKTQHLAEYKHLKLKYIELNMKLFDGQCPKDLVTIYAGKNCKVDLDIDWDYLSSVNGYFKDAYSERSSVIVINSDNVDLRDILSTESTHRTLVHEMCHAYCAAMYGTYYADIEAVEIFNNWPEKYIGQSCWHGLLFLQAISSCAEKLNTNWYTLFGYGANSSYDLQLKPDFEQFAYTLKSSQKRKTPLDKLPQVCWTAETLDEYTDKCQEILEYCKELTTNVINIICNNSNWFVSRFNKSVISEPNKIRNIPYIVIVDTDGLKCFYELTIRPTSIEASVTRKYYARRQRESLIDMSTIEIQLIRFFADDSFKTRVTILNTKCSTNTTQNEIAKEVIKAIVNTF